MRSSRFVCHHTIVAFAFVVSAALAATRAHAAETVRIALPVDAGSTVTQGVVLSNHGGRLVRLWGDNALSTATLTLTLTHHPQAPALYQAALPSLGGDWLSPDLPLPNACTFQACLADPPTSAGLVGVVMLIERP